MRIFPDVKYGDNVYIVLHFIIFSFSLSPNKLMKVMMTLKYVVIRWKIRYLTSLRVYSACCSVYQWSYLVSHVYVLQLLT